MIMWRNIGRTRGTLLTPGTPEHLAFKKRNMATRVDCSSANRGLFLGIFVMVILVISLILFFVLTEKPGLKTTAIIVVHATEAVLYMLAIFAVLIALCRVRDMAFHADWDLTLEECLLMVSLCGVFVFCLLNIVSGVFHMADTPRGLVIVACNLVRLIQASLQQLFLMNALRRSSTTPHHEAFKPGRECVTFLIVANLAMWGISAFEIIQPDANPFVLDFYGHVLWMVVTHLASPLTVCFRFQSVVCLANVWKHAYKPSAHSV